LLTIFRGHAGNEFVFERPIDEALKCDGNPGSVAAISATQEADIDQGTHDRGGAREVDMHHCLSWAGPDRADIARRYVTRRNVCTWVDGTQKVAHQDGLAFTLRASLVRV
jgi:hypothetical protein